MKFLLQLSTIILITVSCSTARPLRNFETNAIPEGLKLTQIRKAIKMAGANKGWNFIKSKEENELVGNLIVRQHEVNVKVPYTIENYQVNYMSSTNMKYNSLRQVIHRSYGRWINNLRQEINKELRRAAASE